MEEVEDEVEVGVEVEERRGGLIGIIPEKQ